MIVAARGKIPPLLAAALCAGTLALAGCPQTQTPVQRAIAYLDAAQTKQDCWRPGHVDYNGNWPQVFHFRNVPGYRIPDVSPFVVVFAHHALSIVTPATQDALGLTETDIQRAREMRTRAIGCLNRFASDPAAHDAGAFGFWPYDAGPQTGNSPLEDVLFELLQGPVLGGDRAPINLSYFPAKLALPADADVTATVYAALRDNELLDGGDTPPAVLESLFGDNRHVNDVVLRFGPDWLPHNSGAYLTWFMNREAGAPQFGNDVDLVVNANVLFALARAGLDDAPGFAETVALINDAVGAGLHRTQWDNISLYYPDSYVFHYCVSRAYAEGPVPALAPAVQQLASELLDEVRHCADGTAYWDKGHPQLVTAFAVLTLINAGSESPVIDDAVAFLERTQDPITGAWDEAPFFIARADTGVVIEWESAPLTTALALEALCKARLRGSA